jgi:hypothetical protein
LPEGVSGIAALHALVADHLGEETDRGPWVQALLAAGYQVYAINPLSAARYRERHVTSGAKAIPAMRRFWPVVTPSRSCRSPRLPPGAAPLSKSKIASALQRAGRQRNIETRTERSQDDGKHDGSWGWVRPVGGALSVIGGAALLAATIGRTC